MNNLIDQVRYYNELKNYIDRSDTIGLLEECEDCLNSADFTLPKQLSKRLADRIMQKKWAALMEEEIKQYRLSQQKERSERLIRIATYFAIAFITISIGSLIIATFIK